MRYQIGSGLAHQVVAGEVVIVDLAGARMLGLNPVGSLVWARLSEDEESIARTVQAAFDVDIETARADVSSFLRDLVERGLVVPVP